MITMDTCAIIWQALKPNEITKKAANAIEKANEDEGMIMSEISLWEIAMLIKKKRLILDTTYKKFINNVLDANHYHLIGITPEIAEMSTEFSHSLNADPADRIISATSVINNAPLITADKNLLKFRSIKTIW